MPWFGFMGCLLFCSLVQKFVICQHLLFPCPPCVVLIRLISLSDQRGRSIVGHPAEMNDHSQAAPRVPAGPVCAVCSPSAYLGFPGSASLAFRVSVQLEHKHRAAKALHTCLVPADRHLT